VGWETFRFVLLTVEQALELEAHGVKPGERELAGLVDHTKAWTPKRKGLFEQIVGRPFSDLVARRDRPIEIHGPLRHAEGGLWASAIETVELAVEEKAQAVVLVENRETFRLLVPVAAANLIVLNVPGGPPPAEAKLVERLSLLAPGLPVYAAFDADPAGIRIALLLEQQAGVKLNPIGMSPEFLRGATKTRALNEWDRELLERLRGRAGVYEPLRDAIETLGYKAEQEVYQRRLFELFEAA
jgi:hypothetical protein